MSRLRSKLVAATVPVLVFAIGGCGGAETDPSPPTPPGTGATPAKSAAADEGSRERRPAASLAARMEDLTLSPERALGQAMVGRYSGRVPSGAFLARARAGELGGVILFGDNVEGGEREVRRSIQLLQRAALAGGNPPLLILIDQEGGPIERLPGPPHLAPPEIRSPAQAERQGRLTGRYLRALGINVDLAPVADVPAGETFIRERAFGSGPETVAARACAFARGLRAEGVGATLKHFPGLGLAEANTDAAATTVTASPGEIRAGYAPYRACGSEPGTLTMLSSARYPQLTGGLPAVMATRTYTNELPSASVRGPLISDDLQAPALEGLPSPATTAIAAGLDLLLYAKTEEGSANAYAVLRDRLAREQIDGRYFVRNARPVLALKALLEPGLTARFLAVQDGAAR